MAREISYEDAASSTKQLKWTGKGYLDAKMQPVPNFADLNDIPRSQRFIGLTVVVINDENSSGTTQEYWLKSGVSNDSWEKKGCSASLDIVTGDDIYT